MMRKLFVQPLSDLAACLNQLAQAQHPFRSLGLVLVVLVVTWFVYVPIHELLHAAGCLVTGGSVSRLEIAPHYGGALLARWVPFVVSGGEYAGRLSGFDTGGSDWVYLATDFAPFVLSVVFGVPFLKASAARRRPILFGIGIVVGLAPFTNLIGDYYEMGSIITTRVLTLIQGGGETAAFVGIRSDDIFKLVGALITNPGGLGFRSPGALTAAALLTLTSLLVGLVLSLITYALGHGFSAFVLRRRARATP